MITHTNNNRALFLAGIELWLERPDVREMHYGERDFEIHIAVRPSLLEAGVVEVNVGIEKPGAVAIGELRATVVNMFSAVPQRACLDAHEIHVAADNRPPAAVNTQLLLL